MVRVLTLLLLLTVPALAAERPIYRIDSVVATHQGGQVVIEAKGAVQSGGWTRPRLKLLHSDGHTLVVQFLAQAPQASAPVIEALLPMTARLTVKAPRGTMAVRAQGQANDVTAQILN